MSVESIKARLEAATLGIFDAPQSARVWLRNSSTECVGIVDELSKANLDLIAHTPTDIAALLKVVEAVRELANTIGADDRERQKWERIMFAALDELEDME